MASLKDLMVLGPARFLDNIYGNLKGNADTASKWAAKINVAISATASDTSVGQINGAENATLYIPKTLSGFSSITATSFIGTASVASKLGTTTVGGIRRPIYLNAGVATQVSVPSSGAWFTGIPSISSDGVTELGRYIDFHNSNASTNDFDVRIDAASASKNTLYLPGITGQFVVHTNDTAIGGSTKPVYIAASGAATAISSIALGSSTSDASRYFQIIKKSPDDASYGLFKMAISNAANGALLQYSQTGTDGVTTTKYIKMSTSAFYPTENADFNLGTSSLRWKNVYANDFNGTLIGVIRRQFDTDDSRALALLNIYKADNTTLQMCIGAHNTGHSTGAIWIKPSGYDGNSWDSDEGLYISKDYLLLDNKRVPTTQTNAGSEGGTAKPVYVTGGIIKPISATVGSGIKPVYLNAGTITVSNSTVGTTAKPIYLTSGTITECTPADVFSALSWSAGDSSGPVLNVTIATKARTATIPSASASASGIVTTDSQTFAGTKTFSNNVYVNAVNRGFYLKDKSGASYPGIYDNGSNLWIGSTQSATTHHVGSTYISAGYNGTTGNTTAYIAVPNDTNTGASTYGILHLGNYASTLDGRYLKLAGGTMSAGAQIIRAGKSCSWVAGRDNALIRINTINGYSPTFSIKTDDGSWEIGAYNYTTNTSWENKLIFTYISDTNYNANTNEVGGQFTFSPSGYFSGAAAKADKLTTARTLTIGSKGKTFDGSANVSWSHSEIGATVSNTWTGGTTAGPTIKTTVNGVTGTAVAIPSASASASGIVTTGGQTLAGAKTFTSNITIKSSASWSLLQYYNTNLSGVGLQLVQYTPLNSEGTAVTANRLYVRTYSYTSGTKTRLDYYEDFRLPSVDVSRTSNSTYDILTTKSRVTIAQGGTGSGTKVGAKTNLGITYGTALPSTGEEGDIFFVLAS